MRVQRTGLLLLVALSAVAFGCERAAGAGDDARSWLVDVGGGSGAPRDVRRGAALRDAAPAPDGGADDAAPPADAPRADVAAPPDTGVSLAPDCPPAPGPWRAWFSKSVSRAAAPAAPEACGDVRLDRALAWVIGQAQTSVDLAVYSLDAKQVADALIAAHGKGRRVRVVVDDDDGAAADNTRVDELRAAGLDVRDDGDAGRLMHHKFAVVDGARVWFGSANAGAYDGAANANNVLLVDDATLAGLFAAEFEGLWAGGFHEDKGAPRALTLDGGAARLFFSPDRDAAVEAELLALIAGAEHEIFVSLFAFTRQDVADALERRCGDVAVVVLLDQDALTEPGAVTLDLCADGQLLADAVTPSGGLTWPLTLHHKLMIVDGRSPDGDPVLVTGSMNWSANGLFRNDEATLVWHHAGAAGVYVQEFAARVTEAGGTLPPLR